MLTAAICGEVFASPQVDSILAGIRAVDWSQGMSMIVTNYTGDRLNFGLAAEQAKSEGYKVETVIVGDDCALPPSHGVAGRRGLAGTILVHKVAGAAAAAGLSLDEVAAEAKRASEMVGTMGVALSVCTMLHGEPGAVVADLQPVEVVVSHVLKQILSPETNYVPITRGNRVVLMVNGLGATPVMELMIAAGKAVPQLQLEHGLAVDRVYTGSFMTSLDMAGFSISIMKADEAILHRLDAATKAPFWPAGVDGNRPPAKIPIPLPLNHLTKSDESMGRPLQLSEQGQILELAIEAAANAIIDLRDILNEWDSKVGDGDCGSTMDRGATAILEDMKKYKCAFDLKHSLEPGADVLEASIAAVSKYGGASAGYRTLLDALIPASSVLQERLTAGDDPITAFILSSEAALAGAESTRHMQAQAGRSTYVSTEILASVPDPGAMAAASWYRAAALAIKNKVEPS
ncbi:hypothetical protein GH714_025054 [Hevea brasiliensis]|uniref:DhaK domain-containing protein n=1 Tax=Hevea brasiliensis TaxID=3981 RepID=A0A6A6MUQ2_HEVBR|nr:hypothetical protein GH714_025054 [Hevea brasiliensis]